MFNSEKPIIQIAYSSKDIISEAKKWSKQFNIDTFYINEHIKVYENALMVLRVLLIIPQHTDGKKI